MPSTHVALVDDDQLILASLGDALESAGYTVSRFRSGEAALTALWTAPLDLLVVDLLLPGMTGIDLAEELRRRRSGALPVLAISALSWSQRILGRTSALSALLPKPVESEDLLATARALLEGAPAAPPHAGAQVLPGRSASGRVRLEVRLASAAECVCEYTQNLAHDGLFLRTYDPLPVETPVDVELALPFLAEPLLLEGRVVRVVPVDSADARISGPGMGLALSGVPRELKLQLQAYVAGVRAGNGQGPAATPRARRVLLAGLDGLLPRDAAPFLRRAGLRVERSARLGETLLLLQHVTPDVIFLAAELLGSAPKQTLSMLEEAAGHAAVAVVADAARAPALEGLCELLDAEAPAVLLDAISARLGVARRTSARVRCQLRLATLRAEGRREAELEDLSLSGLLMTTPEAVAVGERFGVEFALPDLGRISGRARAVRVVRTRPDETRLSVGVAFERLDDDSPERLRRFIQARTEGEVLH